MQITLNQDEIEEAIRNYVHGQVSIRESQMMTIDLRAGRGENGFTATLDVQPRTMGTVFSEGPQLVARASKADALEAVEEPKKAATAPNKAEKPKVTEAVEEPKALAAAKASKKSIFAVPVKKVEEIATEIAETTTKEVTETEPGVPDQEAPAEEEAGAETEETNSEVTEEEAAPTESAEPVEVKKSIFAFGPKKSNG